jgi:hypothetical protein
MVFMTLFHTSCRVEKRVHRPGYHVEWHHKKKTSPSKEQILVQVDKKAKTTEINFEKEDYSELLASVSADIPVVSNFINKPIRYENRLESACDTIVLVSGKRILGLIIEINQEYILYAECVDHYGPFLRVDRSELKEILYRNGSKEDMDEYLDRKGAPSTAIKREFEPFGFISFALGIFSIFWAAWLFGPLAIIASIISVIRITSNPDHLQGLVFSFIGLSLGTIVTLIVLQYLF